jgi:hypothetical protein
LPNILPKLIDSLLSSIGRSSSVIATNIKQLSRSYPLKLYLIPIFKFFETPRESILALYHAVM